jgi:hypothetical protein
MVRVKAATRVPAAGSRMLLTRGQLISSKGEMWRWNYELVHMLVLFEEVSYEQLIKVLVVSLKRTTWFPQVGRHVRAASTRCSNSRRSKGGDMYSRSSACSHPRPYGKRVYRRILCEAAVESEKDWGQPWGNLDSEARQPDRPCLVHRDNEIAYQPARVLDQWRWGPASLWLLSVYSTGATCLQSDPLVCICSRGWLSSSQTLGCDPLHGWIILKVP